MILLYLTSFHSSVFFASHSTVSSVTRPPDQFFRSPNKNPGFGQQNMLKQDTHAGLTLHSLLLNDPLPPSG